MTVGESIKAARKRAKLSQKELGKILGVSGSMIGQYESGQRNPKPSTLQRIADALGVPEPELQGLTYYGHGVWLNEAKLTKEQIEEGMKLFIAQEKEIELQQKKEENRRRLDTAYGLLNIDGQSVAVERVEELTEIPRYQRQDAPQSPPAPQPGTDTPSQKKPPESP